MASKASVREVFPELEEISDESFRDSVERVLVRAIEESEFDSYDDVPWWPPYEPVVGDERNPNHVRDVTRNAIAITEAVSSRRDVDVDLDFIIAGALLHDVTKTFELAEEGTTKLDELIPHPHYAVYLLADEGFSLEMQHLVLAHSGQSAVEPKTMEAAIIKHADRLASQSAFWEAAGKLGMDS
jgi:hypothetical protein